MQLLRDLGFIINSSKSDLAPQRFVFLGLVWDTSIPSVTLTVEKVETLSSSAISILGKPLIRCQNIQQFLGRMNFAAFAVPHARLNSCAILACLSAT